jgi:hypothetical protein
MMIEKVLLNQLIKLLANKLINIIVRSLKYKGQSAVKYKSSIRKEIEEEGYRIWGNVGDQWTDLQGECLGNRTFKIPNPMYCIS